jgi:hypothetical protein
MLRYAVGFVVALGISVGGASAASLHGEAMVNGGQGYKAQTGGELKIGDSVMVRQGTSATIAYKDGCSFTLSAGRVLTVGATSPCADVTQAGRQIDFSGRMGQSGQSSNNDDNSGGGFLPPGGGVNPVVIVGGVAVAVGAGLLIYNANKKSSSD